MSQYAKIKLFYFFLAITGLAIITFALHWVLGVFYISLVCFAMAWAAQKCETAEKEDGQ